MLGKPTPSSDYTTWLGELKSRIQSARISAARSVNRDLILLYWDIGRGIVEKQEELGWGESVIEQLSGDLRRAFPETKGFSSRNLRNMKRLFSTYANTVIWQQAVAELPAIGLPAPNRQQAVAKLEEIETTDKLRQLVVEVPWGHNMLILNKLSEPKERLYYLYTTAQGGWTRSVLLNQIKADAYGRSLAKGKAHNFPLALPEHLAEQAEESLKSSYNLEFLGIGRAIKERELEDKLIEQLKDFILELGYGFCFIDRQHRVVAGKKEYFIDLLFYHRFLKCLVAIELKIGEFQPEFAGKMDFYLNVLNKKERATDDNPSIGIILCAEKDDVVVEFALKSKTNPIGVAEYQLKPTLPKELKGKLPTADELGAAIGLPTKRTGGAKNR
ncbi:MAG: PDDEXK nuclease domain-containing protein [Gammaproteobacteria bacterium]|nr:PDDEXK nuclease domain-containing protein [Gammaproteobacteria bacterium]MDE0283293.1 PDDEXK nuclease domain-containing protein [Gammaproteobacteria bacterium]MDE0514392.1 PDDEXK nuclease domain-containing protein [Gammaproteobacteria bacterium]